MRIYIFLVSMLASCILSSCSSQGTVRPMPSDLLPTPAEQNQAKLDQALTS